MVELLKPTVLVTLLKEGILSSAPFSSHVSLSLSVREERERERKSNL